MLPLRVSMMAEGSESDAEPIDAMVAAKGNPMLLMDFEKEA